MALIKLAFTLIKGGKRGIAIAGLIAVYVLQKYFGIAVTEAEVTEQIMLVLGAVGVIHGVWKSGLVQGVIAKVKTKNSPVPGGTLPPAPPPVD